MSASSVPKLEITSTGINAPSPEEILNGALNDWNNAFGGSLNIINLETPQGEMSQFEADVIQINNDNLTYLASQFDPPTAQGRWLDAYGRLYPGMTRTAGEPTVVTALCTGIPGQGLPAGVLASDGTNTYVSLDAAVFNGGGTASVEFACTVIGEVPLPANTLTQIVTLISGWDTIDNPTPGTPGISVESDYAFRQRILESVALNAQGTNDAVRANVLAVNGVLDCFVTDNPLGSPITYGATNYPMLAHSLTVSVVGGASDDIANAIWNMKSPGCDMNGNVTVQVPDTAYPEPYPLYNITFLRPANTPIYFVVDIANNTSLLADIVTMVQDAILAEFNGQNNNDRASINSTIYASSYYGAVSALSTSVNILSMTVGKAPAPITTSVAMGIDEEPTLDAVDIVVNLI